MDDVSFEVGQREVMGLLGPNGSGKTTILRILTGYLRPSAGTVRVGGLRRRARRLAARGAVGYVPEDAPLYPHMRVDEFLAFMGRLHGLDGRPLQRAVDVACERLALEDVAEAIIGRLSRGYRQRVAIAQAMLHEPELLVLDEPTNGLDPRQIIEFANVAASPTARSRDLAYPGEIERRPTGWPSARDACLSCATAAAQRVRRWSAATRRRRSLLRTGGACVGRGVDGSSGGRSPPVAVVADAAQPRRRLRLSS